MTEGSKSLEQRKQIEICIEGRRREERRKAKKRRIEEKREEMKREARRDEKRKEIEETRFFLGSNASRIIMIVAMLQI